MPRKARHAPGGLIYHVLNRAAGRAMLFSNRRDYEAFQRRLVEAVAAVPIRVLAYCVMPNHWHLVLWPERNGQLARFMLRLTVSHARRWWVDRPQTAAEEAALLRCIRQGRPFGDERWLKKMEKTLAWREPLPRGRPRKAKR